MSDFVQKVVVGHDGMCFFPKSQWLKGNVKGGKK